MVTISRGNMKLGRIPNVSLPPVASCPRGVPCAKDCYAMKAYKMYPNVRKAWDGNWDTWFQDPVGYFLEIGTWLDRHRHKVPRFRWHVAGDIPQDSHGVSYLTEMQAMATLFPETGFLAFTKRYDLLGQAEESPANLTVVVSRWPGHRCPDTTLPQAWMYDEEHQDVYIPDGTRTCPGSCSNCSLCFNAKPGTHVVFRLH